MTCKTGPWESETGEPFLTQKGYQALNNYGQRQDIFRVYCYMQCYQTELKDLRIGDVIIGPSFGLKNYLFDEDDKRHEKENIFKLNDKGIFIQIQYNEENRKLIRNDVRIYDTSWFSWNGQLYFASWNFKKIEKLSIYFTQTGINYLLNKRKNYVYVRDNPAFGPNQTKAFKKIPEHKDWW